MDSMIDALRQGLSDFSLLTLYLSCAALGGGILVLQLLAGLIGLGGDADVDLDSSLDGSDGAFNLLSIRSISGFLLFFGLVGWGGYASGWPATTTLAAATFAGASVMVLIAWALAAFRRLTTSGTLDLRRAVGRTARVYLRIPPRGEGRGKVTVSIDGRSAELQAISADRELPTGAVCRIVRFVDTDTVEVEGVKVGED